MDDGFSYTPAGKVPDDVTTAGYSCTSNEHTQQSRHTVPLRMHHEAENHQNTTRYTGGWVTFEDDETNNSQTAVTCLLYNVDRGHGDLDSHTARDHKQIANDTYGNVRVPPVRDAHATDSPEVKVDVIQPHSDPSHHDQTHDGRVRRGPAVEPFQLDPYYLLPFKEWYQGYNSEVQQGEQPTPSWKLPPTQPQHKAPSVPNYLILSIVACFFCIFIGGIALSYAITSSKHRKAGNYKAALESASTAKNLSILALVFGVITIGVGGFLIWYQIQHMNKILYQKT